MIQHIRSIVEHRPLALLAAAVSIATILRLAMLVSTPLNLGPDEAQYWSWSLSPAFGYFSKPPLIAWIIGASTSLCGDGEACIRSSAPLFHAATSFIIFFAARALYDQSVGLWSAISYLCMPGTSFSSLLITTDVPLLLCWALALWAIAELRREASGKWAIILGAAIGLGLLAKYAMLYFVLGLVLALLPLKSGRALIFSSYGLTAFVSAAAIFAPNVIWNISNSFATVRHTASNANWGTGDLFNLSHAFNFLGAQIGILGPIGVGIICWGLIRKWRQPKFEHADTLLLALSVPVIAIVTLQAFISRANANWAAPAFIALTILACAWAMRRSNTKLLIANAGVNIFVGIVLALLAVSPAFVTAIGQENSVKRLRGWDEAGRTIITIASSSPFTAILSDDREDMASLFYYTRARKQPLRMWPKKNPANEYESSYALSPELTANVLFITRRTDARDITDAFASSERIGTIETRLDSKRKRIFYLFALKGPVPASNFPSIFDRPSTD